MLTHLYKIFIYGIRGNMNLLNEKIALESQWTKLYKQNGVYTTAMIPLTMKIRELTKQIIVQDQEQAHKRFHNQTK